MVLRLFKELFKLSGSSSQAIDRQIQDSLTEVELQSPLETWEIWNDELFEVDEKRTEFDLVRILDTVRETVEEGVQSAGKGERDIFSQDEIVRIYIGLGEQNQDASKAFYHNMRHNATRMVQHNYGTEARLFFTTQAGVEDGEWMNMADIRNMVEHWHLPLAIHRRGESHYTLVLRPPERDISGSWRVLTYDPKRGGVGWDSLPNGNISDLGGENEDFSLENEELDGLAYSQTNDGTASEIYLNDRARELFATGSYNLDVRGDEDIANNPELLSAKSVEVQFDHNNCGLACVMMAAIRAGLKGDEAFIKGNGRAEVYRDTGVRILLRDEVLNKVEPPNFEDLLKDPGEDIVFS